MRARVNGEFARGHGVETERFSPHPEMAVADVDLGRIRQERMRTNTFGDNARASTDKRPAFRNVAFEFAVPDEALELRRAVERFPYVDAAFMTGTGLVVDGGITAQ